MKNQLIIVALSCLMLNCNRQSQKKDTVMTTEKFDVESFNKRKEKDPTYGGIITLEDGTVKKQSGPGIKGGAFEQITPPLPIFYKINKGYHKSTNILEAKGKIIGDLSIDTWQYFDEQGRLVKETDENVKFGKHHYNDALKFLEKEGWINLKTGEGRERFSLGYENNVWYITILSQPWNGNVETYYEVSANTMETLKKEVTQRGKE